MEYLANSVSNASYKVNILNSFYYGIFGMFGSFHTDAYAPYIK